MKSIGFFSEMKLYQNDGSIKDNLVDDVNYDKEKIIEYLKSQKEKISDSFSVYNDGEYKWCDFLIYHIEKYNIKLPD